MGLIVDLTLQKRGAEGRIEKINGVSVTWRTLLYSLRNVYDRPRRKLGKGVHLYRKYNIKKD